MKINFKLLWLCLLCMVFSFGTAQAANQQTTINDLNPALQYLMSEEMAKDNPAFHFKKQGETYRSDLYARRAL